MGIPSDREQYIHRLGRTGRQGKEGEGILLLAPWEQFFMDDIKDLPVEKCTSPHLDPDAIVKVCNLISAVDRFFIFSLKNNLLLFLFGKA